MSEAAPTGTGLRVLFCCNAYPPHFIGGAELIAEKYARALIARGDHAAVFTAESQVERGAPYELFEDTWNDVPVYRIQTPHTDYQATGDGFVNSLVEERFDSVLDAFRPDIVHCHNLAGLTPQILHLAKRRGLGTGLTLHDHWMFCVRNTLVRPDGTHCDPLHHCDCQTSFTDRHTGCERPIELREGFMSRMIEEVDFFHFPSRYLMGMYQRWGVPAERSHWIPYGIELERYEQVQKTPRQGKVRFAFIGYLGEHKGVLHLLDAFAALPAETPATLDLVGGGHLQPELERRIVDQGLEGRVRLVGKVQNDEIETIYRNIDCLVLPSQWPENHPVSINEAMACGLAVLATDGGGTPELVRHKHTGWLVPVGNVAAITEGLAVLASHPDAIDSMGEQGRRDSQRRSLDGAMASLTTRYLAAKGPASTAPPAARRSTILLAMVGSSREGDALCRAIGRSDLRSAIDVVDFHWLLDRQRLAIDVLWLLGPETVDDAVLWSADTVLVSGTAASPRAPRVLRADHPEEVIEHLRTIVAERTSDDQSPPRRRVSGDGLDWLRAQGALQSP